jgi:hypothetical protein
MNTMGKILVIINTLFALFTGGFLAVDWATRTNWKKANDELKQELQVARANGEAGQQTIRLALGKLQQAEGLAKGLQKELETKTKKYEKDFAELKKGNKDLGMSQNQIVIGDTLINAELQRLRVEIKDRNEQNERVTKELVDLREKLRAAKNSEITALNDKDQALSRLFTSQDHIRELEKKVATSQMAAAPGGGAAPTVKDPSQPNPPSAYVRGRIEKVDPSGLLQLSVGSDAGLQVNQTLDVFRLRPEPKYLGMVRIVDADLHKSIGRLVTRPGTRTDLRPGDEVASSIQPPR